MLKNLQNIFTAIAAALIAFDLYLIFMLVPNEAVMGAVQRIFYFHVGCAIASYAAIATMLFGSVSYLATRKPWPDALAVAAAEVSLLFCSITLISGMIWGQAAWGTWFRWEPRLVTFLLLWFILVGYNLLRAFGERGRVASHAAVLGIVSAVMVPVVIFSIQLLPSVAQLHPVVVSKGGLKDPLYKVAFHLSWVSLSIFAGALIIIRKRIELLRGE